ncbi:MAG: DUF4440 domain-containing protein [Hahellaceae bacterium]|nr:DUF4440 domain-containing protein [Hahellaceae bacterium]
MTPAQTIHNTIETMTTAFAAGDLEKILATYSSEAVIVGDAGQEVRGQEDLTGLFREMLPAGAAFTYGAHQVVVSGDIALHLMKWSAPDSQGNYTSALSVAVLRRQADGLWKIVIDHPFGDQVMAI